MDNPEPQYNPQAESAELIERCDSLQYFVTWMLALLTVLAAVLATFLWHVQKDKGFELANFSIQATNFIAQYEHGPGPAQAEFLRKIVEYGRTHPDFAPILTKYSLKPPATPSTPAPGFTPPPGASQK